MSSSSFVNVIQRIRITSGLVEPSLDTIEFSDDFTITVDESAGKYGVALAAVAASVAQSFTWTATAPVRVNGGASATMAAPITLSVNAADGSNRGTMSATHYSLVNGAAVSPTASTLVKRDTDGSAQFDGVSSFLSLQATGPVELMDNLLVDGNSQFDGNVAFSANIGFFTTPATTQKTVAGSRANPEQTLKSLLQALEDYGLIVDSSTA